MQRELVERARAGDREAFSELARATLDRQYAVAHLILRDCDRAQDAVQEALVSAWRDERSLRVPTRGTPGSTASPYGAATAWHAMSADARCRSSMSRP